MRQQLEDRLKELKSDFEDGRKQLAALEGLRQTLFRISGAIQVLEELLGETPSATPSAKQG